MTPTLTTRDRRSPAGGRRRVVVLNHFALPMGGPGGTRHVEMFGDMPGWESTIIASATSAGGARDAGDGLSCQFVPVWAPRHDGSERGRIINWGGYALSALVRSLLGRRPDVVYASVPHLLAGVVGWIVATGRRSKFVLEVRDLWPDALFQMGRLRRESVIGRTLRGIERLLYSRAELIVVLADGVRQTLVGAGVPADRIVLIPNGADVARLRSDADRDSLRRAFGFTGTTFVYTGAHGIANGLDAVLDAAAELRDELPDVQFALVGRGPRREALRQRAEAQNLQNVRFLDAVPKSRMGDLLRAADVGVHVLADLPLFSYGVSPNKLYDYMAAGLPVLTNVPGEVTEIVVGAGAGLAVAPDGIARGVREFSSMSEQQRRRYGAAGQAFVVRERSRAVLTAQLAAALDTLVTPTERRIG